MTMYKSIFYILIIALIVAISINLGSVFSSEYILDESRHVVIVAISTLANGSYVGVSADLYVRVTCPGYGRVYVETLPLSQIDLQASTRVAALVASSIANISFNVCDYYASIRASSPIVGGPSASGATAVAFTSALLRLPLNNSVVMTGMIMPDGSIGPVGGLKYKLEAALNRGAKVFLVPYGQTIDYTYSIVEERWGPAIIRRTAKVPIDLVEYGKELGIEVKSIATVYEALEIFTNGLYRVKINADFLNNRINQVYDVVKPVVQQWITDLKNEAVDISKKCNEMKEGVLLNVKQKYGLYVYNQISSKIRDLELNIEELTSKADKMVVAGKLYVAASMYFQVLIYAYTEFYLLNILNNSKSIMDRVNTLRSEVNDFIEKIHSYCKEQVDIMKLTIAINVLDRAYETLLYLNRSLNLSDILSIASAIAYADARFQTAKQWYELMAIPTNSGIIVASEDIKPMAMYIEMLVQNIYSYLISLVQYSALQLPKEVDEAEQRYNLMQSATEEVDKLALGISSISYMYQVLIALFTQSSEASIYTLNKTVYTNLNFVIENMPIDVVLYLEFAKSLVEENPESSIIMLAKLSTIIAIYRTLISSSASNISLQPTTSQVTANPTTNFVHTSTPTITPIIPTTLTLTVTATTTITETIYKENITAYVYTVMGALILLAMMLLFIIFLVFRKLKAIHEAKTL
ncbi:MAG: S16 family serine protease [Ignisphaera sp.]|uniref:Lon proteolytic domain-containing protein n=1 Tax=Ignisphaera aggregans TaxID=334771 RepID=A0A7C4JIL1_9CREN